MSRLNEDNDLISVIKELEMDFNELKGDQIVGSDAVKTFKSQTVNMWDIEITLPPNVFGKEYNYTARFTPEKTRDGKQPACFKIAENHEVKTSSQYPPTPVILILRKPSTSEKYQDFAVKLTLSTGDKPTTYRIKFYALSTGKGSLTLV
jgi:hypothetical protein|nr:MAG TPA: hypothetical protein [Caudoviricetes sp.]